MVVDFSKLDFQERPIFVLKNTFGSPIGTLGSAMDVAADIKFNETSVLEFIIPAQIDGVATPHYESAIGMRIIEWEDIGQFILMNPKEVNDGVKKQKQCKAYSLEYEFTFKKLSLAEATYNFWNPTMPDGTLLQIILDLMPSWSVGRIDSELVGKYRTFEVSNENLYNFIKGTVQKSYNCIFDFDTMNRRINVISAKSTVSTNPVYISNSNLAKEITVEENTENIVTRLDVNGADGVTIRDVNPTGTNQIINLDYFMNSDNFDNSLIEKYWDWKNTYKNYQQQYYNLSVEYALLIMQKTTEQAALTDLEGEMTSLENSQAVIIQAIASNLDQQSSLDAINADIASKQMEINGKKAQIASIEANAEAVYNELAQINKLTKFESYFTQEEYLQLDRYIKDDAVSESSFVVQTTDSYTDEDIGNNISNITVNFSKASIAKVTNSQDKDIYDIKGGNVVSSFINAEIISAAFEKSSDGTFVMTAYLGPGTTNDIKFPKGCFSITGDSGAIIGDLITDDDFPDLKTGTRLSVGVLTGYLYFTRNTSEYEKRSVAWDLYEYGNEILTKISQPAYTFGITSSNFLRIDEFTKFKNSLRHGEKIYVGISEDKTLAPICVGIRFEFDSPETLTLEFSDTYVSSDSSFLLADLLEQSVSMGKSVDLNKYSYSAFMDSGASTKVKDFMSTALDVSKNAILSSKDQAISWGDSGIRLRKWKDEEHTEYEPKQVWLNNNSILMTSNNWSTAELAIGNFYDKNLGDCWGVVAPNIVGTLLAGSNLVIESAKQDGGVAVFKVDAEGCVLHNSNFSVTSDSTNTHILIDPSHGLMIGRYPLIKVDGTIEDGNKLFYADTDGNLILTGTIYATAGEFTGKITATSGYIGQPSQGWTIVSNSIYNGKSLYSSNDQGVYIGTNGIALGDGTSYIRASKTGYLYANHVSLTGSITATSGIIGGCEIQDNKLIVKDANITGLNASKITAGTMSADRISGGSIDATNVTITNLNASNITAGTLDCSKLTVSNLRADSITVGTLKANQIDGLPASQIVSGVFATERIPELSADKITSGTIDASVVTVTNLNADNIIAGTISADRISGGTISGCAISIGSFTVSSYGYVNLGRVNGLFVYGDAGLWNGLHQGITDAIPYMNNTVDQYLLYTLHGIIIGYGNN